MILYDKDRESSKAYECALCTGDFKLLHRCNNFVECTQFDNH